MEKINAKIFPAEIQKLSRFFPVGTEDNPKAPKVKDWGNPEKQTTLENIDGAAGFDICGHDNGTDYIFLDFDHVLNKDTGDFVNDTVKTFFQDFKSTFRNVYVEKSVSNTGLHAFLNPTADKFGKLSAGRKATIYFSDSQDKDAPKLELFYKQKARYCLMTGNKFDSGYNIPRGEEADEYLTKLLDIIASQINQDNEIKSVLKDVSHTDTPPEYQRDLAVALWNFGDFANLERADWLPAVSALKNLGFSASDVKSMCENSTRYDENAFDAEFDSLKDISTFGIETLIGKAKTFDFKSFARQWYEEHPQFKSKLPRSNNDEITALFDELRKVDKQIADFDAEKDKAIDSLTELVTFDRDTIFTDNVLTAAAFAKIFNRQVFSELKTAIQKFKKAHQKSGVALPDFSAAVTDFVKSINSRRAELESQRTKIKAKISTLKFIANNDFLKNFSFPDNFSIDEQNGIKKIIDGKAITVCRLPLLIAEKFQSVDDSTYKYILAYSENGEWKFTPPTPANVIFNQRKIVDLALYNAPITGVNSFGVVDWLDAFKTVNSNKFPLTRTLRRGGWYNFNNTDYFLDPRRKCEYTADNGDFCKFIVEDNQFTRGLKTKGSFDKWRKVHDQIKNYPVARAIVAASIAAPLLHILGERTFIFYVYGTTTSGKSTALKLGASVFGDIDKVTRNFNGTTRGLAELPATFNDYSLLVDEKQGADEKLRNNLVQLVYNFAEGQGRTRLDSNANLKDIENWRTVVVMNGETPLHDDNATAGSFTRTLTIALNDTVLPADICADVWDIVPNNHGFAFVPYIDEFFNYGFNNLRDKFKDIASVYKKIFPDILPEYCRYLAVMTLADAFLYISLGVDKMAAFEDSTKTFKKLFPLIPTISDIDDATREIDFVKALIARNSAHFKGYSHFNPNLEIFGERDNDEGYFYIINTVFNEHCQKAGYNPKKAANDLVKKNFFVPADTIEKGRSKPLNTVVKRINGDLSRCYRIKLESLNDAN